MQYGVLRNTRSATTFSPEPTTQQSHVFHATHTQPSAIAAPAPVITSATTAPPRTAAALPAYGAQAELVAARCTTNLAILFCDATQPALALAEASRRRNAGESFLVAPLLDDTQTVLARAAALNIFNQFKDTNQRLELFASLAEGSMHFNGLPIFHNEIYQAQTINTLAEITQLGDGLFVRSQLERMRIEKMLRIKQLHVAVAPLIDQTVPNTRPDRDASYVVVWAPESDALDLATYSFALSQLNKQAIFVCRGKIEDAPHHFVERDRAQDALANATVVIDTNISDPGTAIALAGRGFGIATSITSGAHEYVQGVATYNLHDFTSVSNAITLALQDRRAYTLPMFDTAASVRATLLAAQRR